MLHYLVELIIWMLLAFLLGMIIGCLIRRFFLCRRGEETAGTAPTATMTGSGTAGETATESTESSTAGRAAATTGAATLAATGAAAAAAMGRARTETEASGDAETGISEKPAAVSPAPGMDQDEKTEEKDARGLETAAGATIMAPAEHPEEPKEAPAAAAETTPAPTHDEKPDRTEKSDTGIPGQETTAEQKAPFEARETEKTADKDTAGAPDTGSTETGGQAAMGLAAAGALSGATVGSEKEDRKTGKKKAATAMENEASGADSTAGGQPAHGEEREALPPFGLSAPLGGKPDNLTHISGIGKKIEKLLHEMGIFHFRQIASWTEKDIEEVDKRLKFRGRIVREKWVEQARVLAEGGETDFARRVAKGDVPTSRQD